MIAAPRALAAYLKQGGLIAYPTESCYGLGCDPRHHAAVQRLLKLKGRPQHKGLILIAGRYAQLRRFIQPLNTAEQARLQHDGAQAITYLMPILQHVPRGLRGRHDTLAVRWTAHPDAARLCNALNMALVSTSANYSGGRAARTAAECRKLFGAKVKVIAGNIGKRKKPSTIRAWTGNQIIRH